MDWVTISEGWTEKALVEHQCVWCGEEIKVGESYCFQAGTLNREFQFNKWHPECLEAACDRFCIRTGFELHSYHRGSDKER